MRSTLVWVLLVLASLGLGCGDDSKCGASAPSDPADASNDEGSSATEDAGPVIEDAGPSDASDPPGCMPAGGECSNHGDCCGFSSAVGALCIDLDGADGSESPTCIANCDAEHPCAEGFSCRPTTTDISVCVAI